MDTAYMHNSCHNLYGRQLARFFSVEEHTQPAPGSSWGRACPIEENTLRATASSKTWCLRGRMRWVVVDEADLLLTGGFKRDVRMILSSMKEGDRIAAAESVCHELGMEIERFWELPRALQRTAIQGAPLSDGAVFKDPK